MNKIKKTQSKLQYKMKRATDIYAYNALLVVRKKEDRLIEYQQVLPEMKDSENHFLNNFKADSMMKFNFECFIKEHKLKNRNTTTAKI